MVAVATTARVVGFEVVVVVTCFASMLVVVGVALLVDVAFGSAATVVEVTTAATVLLPVSIETLYAETAKTAPVPEGRKLAMRNCKLDLN